jgi:adenosylmethionine---8-amino-7-oxononanoate aminotransferase
MTLATTSNIWHPFTQMKTAPEPLSIVKSKGAYLITEQGDSILDAISSWWSVLHGHCQEEIMKAIQDQTKTLDHVLLAGCVHPGVKELTEKLLNHLPSPIESIFYSDNGSTAVEVAIKLAIQYWYNKGEQKERYKFLSFKGGYHGDTLGAMSVADRTPFNRPFHSFLFDVTTIEAPTPGNEEKSLQELSEALSKDNYAGFIFEPLVQGVAGMQMHTPEALSKLLRLCHSHDVLCIADEVMTGFGRTGPLFASEYLTESVDMICLSKGITGGVLPLGATGCSAKVYDAFYSDDKFKTFYHGHTFTANPIACSAALASLDLVLSQHSLQQRTLIETLHRAWKMRIEEHPKIKECRVTGTILAVEYNVSEETSYFNNIRDVLYPFFLKHNILLRPLGNIVYILPPYCMTREELEMCYLVIEKSLEIV